MIMDFKKEVVDVWKRIPIGMGDLAVIVGVVVIGGLIVLFQYDPETAKFIAYLTGGGFLLWQVLASSQRAKAAEETAKAMQQTANSTETGNIAERFKNAIEHLGNTSPSIRLGGIYALHHIARDEDDYRKRVFEILCAHIRETTTQKGYSPQKRFIPETDASFSHPIIEIEGILKLLFREPPGHRTYEGLHSNLDHANLEGANFRNSNMPNARFSNANLNYAIFDGAELQEAHFWDANLQNADFSNADLNCAIFDGAKLQGAYFQKTNLQGADLSDANLQDTHFYGANFKEADLQHAVFFNAELQGAFLSNAQSLTAEQLLEARTLYQAKLPGEIEAEIKQLKPELLKELKPDNETDT